MSDLVRKVVEETSPDGLKPERAYPKNCHACTHSYMEPSGPADLICGHPDSGMFGLTLKWILRGGQIETFSGDVRSADLVVKPANHCSDHQKFEQHPLRNQDGSLKS